MKGIFTSAARQLIQNGHTHCSKKAEGNKTCPCLELVRACGETIAVMAYFIHG